MARYLIIAAGSGIGQSLVQHLRQGGHEVMTAARSDRTIAPDYLLDASDFDAVDAVFAKAGKLDGAVNLAGSLLLKSAGLTSRSQYDATITASLTTAFATVRAAARHMTEGGSVVLLSSAAALEGLANHEAIAAAKAGVIGLTRSAAASYAGQNLRINAIAPGLVETPLTAGLVGSDAGRRVSESMHALGRLGKPEDVARAIAFLLDPQNDWITGQVLGVDGGLSRVRPKLKV
ncbi:SDR family NAD(P)-dependent oxidoreductase [Asticcacaulis sp. DW145]|uniref:SDR family oxidoreductase n=1 Tax=Asticcacaulis currens TaxID=2984210 RepID=A0ABT5IAE5_9CAUL|nr:SDR family oxidoreductase [Asticcacaulis currens]MDC7693157.1 SDR family oxidoreductase [Asticcacaulis currens]BEV09749.1 SDR family NAD(P)-dependent oxidoreductase [Asticcacaulis sp. DW145]